ncbi:MAG: HEAT repeat domain-containing protein [Planctomycetaceae bacterium]
MERTANPSTAAASIRKMGWLETWSWKLALGRTRGGSSRQAVRRVKKLSEIAASGMPGMGELVRASLDDSWVIVREAAAKALGSLHDREAVPDLLRVLSTDDSPAVRESAAWALCQLKDPASIPTLLQFMKVCPKLSLSIADGIFRMGREGVPALVSSLEAGDPGVQVIAMDLLGRLQDPRSVRPLLKRLSHPEERVRAASAQSLGNLQDRAVELPLKQALDRETAPAVIAALLRALCLLVSDGESIRFHRFLGHPSATCREAACELLARLRDSRSHGMLIQRLADSDAGVRREAALALEQLAPPEALSALLPLLADPSEEVRAAGCRALGALQDSCAMAPLCLALSDNDPAVRIAAANALGRLGDSRGLEPLCEAALSEQHPDTQIACVRALGQLADPQCLPGLKRLLRQPTPVKTQVVVAIGQLATAEAVEVLSSLLEDPLAIIRYHAALGLGNIGDPRAIPALERQISHPDPLVLRGVVRALGQFGTPQAKALKGRAEFALEQSAVPEPAVAESRPAPEPLRIPVPQAALLGLVGVLLMASLGLWWGWKRITVPAGTAAGASLSFARGDITGLGAAPDPAELRVATSGGWLERWNPASRQLVSRNERRIDLGSIVRFSGDGSLMVTLRDKHLVVCDAATGAERTKVPGFPGLRWLRLNHRGDELAGWDPERGLTIWNLRSAQPSWQMDRDPDLPWSCVTVSEDFGTVALGLKSGDLVVLETGSRRRLSRLKSDVPQPTQVEFSPDGKVLAVVNGRGQVALLDPASNRILERPDCGVTGIGALAWTRDGNALVGIGDDAVFLCERRGGRIIRVPLDHEVSRQSLMFDQLWVDPSAQYVAAASTQGRVVQLWSLPNLTPRTTLLPP